MTGATRVPPSAARDSNGTFVKGKWQIWQALFLSAGTTMAGVTYCALETVLTAAVNAGGVHEATIAQVPGQKAFTLCVTIKSTQDKIFLATRRYPDTPRHFKTIETAAEKAFAAANISKFTVLMNTGRNTSPG